MRQTLTLEAEIENGEKEETKHVADSDSDSDSDSEDEAQQNLQLQALQSELAANSSNYDAHLQVICWVTDTVSVSFGIQISLFQLLSVLRTPCFFYLPEIENRSDFFCFRCQLLPFIFPSSI